MRTLIAISLLFYSLTTFASSAIHQYSETSRVFDALISLEDDAFPGLVEFRYGEDFSLPEFGESVCRVVSSGGVLRMLTDYVDSLNEIGIGEFDTLLFKKQMGVILGEKDYRRCVVHSQDGNLERVDSFISSVDGVYRLWLTEFFAE